MKPSELPAAPGAVVAVDTEGSGLYPDSGATVSVVSIAWIDQDGTHAYAFPFDQGWRDKDVPRAQKQQSRGATLFEGLEDPNLPESEWFSLLYWLHAHPLVAHNVKYDAAMLRTGTRHWPGDDLIGCFVADTLLTEKCLNPTLTLALEDVAMRLWGGQEGEAKVVLSKLIPKIRAPGMSKSEPRYDLVPWADIEHYAATDARQCIGIHHHQEQRRLCGEVPTANYSYQVRREFELMVALYGMERRGIGYDSRSSLRSAQQLEQRRADLAKLLPFKPTVPGAKRYYFKENNYLPYAGVTEKGGTSLDDEALRKMVSDGLPYAAEYQLHTRIDRALSMWYEGYPALCGKDGRLRTNYNQTKVKSGRMSVTRVQLQAIPKVDKAFEGVRHVREFFVARPGYSLWNLDLSQAELRVAARYCGCTTMLDALLGGADFHGMTCERVMGGVRGSDTWDRDRDIAKRLSFGAIFQIGAQTYVAQLRKFTGIELPMATAEAIVRAWRQEYPEFSRAYYRMEKVAKDHGFVWLVPDITRRLQAPGRYSEQSFWHHGDYKYNTAWSRVVQGSLATFNKQWLAATDRWAAQLGVPDALVLNVHDSTVLELPDSEGEQMAAEFARRGGRLGTHVFDVEMKVDVKPWRSADWAPTPTEEWRASA